MIKKLTLAVDESVIKKAKEYARKQNSSLSKLVEYYFSSLTSTTKEKFGTLPPITTELSGMITNKGKVKDKDVLVDALIEKYL